MDVQSRYKGKVDTILCRVKPDDGPEVEKAGNPFHVFHSVADIPLEQWNQVVPVTYTSLRPEMLRALEVAQIPNLEARYVMLFDENRPVGFLYFQIISFSGKQIKAFTQAPSYNETLSSKLIAPFSFLAKKILERSTTKLLVNGNCFLTGEHGMYLVDGFSPEKAEKLILEAIQEIQKEDKKIKSVVIKDGLSAFGFENEKLKEQGFQAFSTDPNMLFTYRDDWANYGDYLLDMSSKYRQRAKSALKKSAGLVVKSLTLEEIEASQERMFELFSGVLSENKFMLAELSLDYFARLKESLGDDFCVFGYYLNGELVAFHTIICHDQYCEAHYLGYETKRNRQMKLYQRMLYDMIQFGFSANTQAISFGRTAMEIKSSIGAQPEPFPCYLKINNRFVNFLASPVVANINLNAWEARHPFKR